jgi:hypothetical protein
MHHYVNRTIVVDGGGRLRTNVAEIQKCLGEFSFVFVIDL